MSDRLEANKRRVVAFYDLMFNQCQPAEAVERYVGDSYTQGLRSTDRPYSSSPVDFVKGRHL
jgi:predicted SnoaL-like aldol condensation-catalyzing enzyme